MNLMAAPDRFTFGSWSPPYLHPVVYIIAQMLLFAPYAKPSEPCG